MSRTIEKLPPRLGITTAYLIGRAVSMRWNWMQDARRAKSNGNDEVTAICVMAARRANRDIVSELRRLRLIGGV